MKMKIKLHPIFLRNNKENKRSYKKLNKRWIETEKIINIKKVVGKLLDLKESNKDMDNNQKEIIEIDSF
jgi:hypothetical protein